MCAELLESSHHDLLSSKCLMTNHPMFDPQLEHASASRVHALIHASDGTFTSQSCVILVFLWLAEVCCYLMDSVD